MSDTPERNPHNHFHNDCEGKPTIPSAKGLRAAGTISILKGCAFGALALATKNLPLAISSGHDIGDKLAYRDEARASEATLPVERARYMRRAADKILWFTIVAGTGEIALEFLMPVGHNDTLGLAGNAASLGLDVVARHYVKNDSNHTHSNIGHTHADTDVRISSVNLIGNMIAVASDQHWVLYPVAVYGIAKTLHSVRSIRADANEIETMPTTG